MKLVNSNIDIDMSGLSPERLITGFADFFSEIELNVALILIQNSDAPDRSSCYIIEKDEDMVRVGALIRSGGKFVGKLHAETEMGKNAFLFCGIDKIEYVGVGGSYDQLSADLESPETVKLLTGMCKEVQDQLQESFFPVLH